MNCSNLNEFSINKHFKPAKKIQHNELNLTSKYCISNKCDKRNIRDAANQDLLFKK